MRAAPVTVRDGLGYERSCNGCGAHDVDVAVIDLGWRNTIVVRVCAGCAALLRAGLDRSVVSYVVKPEEANRASGT